MGFLETQKEFHLHPIGRPFEQVHKIKNEIKLFGNQESHQNPS
jgi:hypothetical protein